MRNCLRNPKLVFLLFLPVIFFLLLLLVLRNTYWGIGLTPDSVVYISTARSLLNGTGLSRISPQGGYTPLSHFPPLYPLLLALFGLLLSQDPLYAAKWLNIFILFLNLILCAIFIYRVTHKSFLLVMIGCLLVASSIIPFLSIHVLAWTEPVYIVFSLMGLLALSTFFERLKRRYLIIAAISFGLAFYTRYVGITLIITGCICLLLSNYKTFAKRVLDIIIFCVIGCFFIGSFVLRNQLVYGNATNRSIAFHPFNAIHLAQFISTETFKLVVLYILLLFVVLLFVRLLTKESSFLKEKIASNIFPLPRDIIILGCYIFIYLTFLVFSISFVDAYTPLSDRLLSPIYVPFIIVLLFVASCILPLVYAIPLAKWLALVVISIVLFAQFKGVLQWTNNNYENGIKGYSEYSWSTSSLLEKIRELPIDVPIFTNGYDVLYIWTQRYSYGLPEKIFPTTKERNGEYYIELREMSEELRDSGGFVVYFSDVKRPYLPSGEELEENIPLEILYESSEGVIYQINSNLELLVP